MGLAIPPASLTPETIPVFMIHPTVKKAALLASFPCYLLTGNALADENLWLYAQGTDTRPKNTWELKFSDMTRLDKGSGQYTYSEIRPEVEYGITDRLTVGGEFIVIDHHYSVEDPDLNPMFDTQGGKNDSFNKTQFGGFEVSMKYNILSPYKDPMGLSVGFAYERRERYRLDGSDIDQDAFIPLVYMQKNFLDNTLVTTFKGKIEFEHRESPGILEEEIALDLAAGVAYRFAPKWYAGLEVRYQSDFLSPQIEGEKSDGGQPSSFDLTDFTWGSQFQYGTYVGPSLHYAEEKWWVTASVLLQVAGGGDESRNPSISGGKVYDEHERVHLGVNVGFSF
jgi:opacity protein-like surface antigen